jgi:hypothetical protein
MCAGRGLRSCTLMFTLRNVPWPQSASVPFGSGPGGQRTVQAVRIHEGKFAGAVPPGSSVLVRKRSGWRGPQSWLSHGSRGRWGRSSNLSWAGAAVVAIGVGCEDARVRAQAWRIGRRRRKRWGRWWLRLARAAVRAVGAVGTHRELGAGAAVVALGVGCVVACVRAHARRIGRRGRRERGRG